MTDIGIFINGTGNDRGDPNPTNIELAEEAFHGTKLYYDGVGTGGWMDTLFGGVFGYGAHRLRDRAYNDLAKVWRPGDRILINGFSRGAAIARMLAWKIGEIGFPGEFHQSRRFAFIDFLGCYDTVASFGIPGNQINLFSNFDVSNRVKNAFHAVSIHEDRSMFPITLMNAREGITEQWFSGVHSDIGGGYKERGLSDIPLKWMLDNARDLGFGFDQTPVGDPNGIIHHHNISLKEPRSPGVLHESVGIRRVHSSP